MNERGSDYTRVHPKNTRVYVGDLAERTDGVGAIHRVGLGVHVLLQATGDDDHILCDAREFLDDQIDHSTESNLEGFFCQALVRGAADAETYVFGLEQLGDCKEHLGCLGRRKDFPLVDEVEDLCQQDTAFPRVDLCACTCVCMHRGFGVCVCVALRLEGKKKSMLV